VIRTAGRFAAMVILGFTYGFATSYIPSPHDVGVFWVSNLAGPWLVLAFVAGVAQVQVRWSIATAIATGLACVAGFYRLPHALNPRWQELGVDRATPRGELLRLSLSRWLDFISYWLLVAVIVGVILGLVGHLWAHRHWRWAGAALGLAIAAEPLYWRFVADGYWPTPIWIWPIEVFVGLALASLLVRARHAAEAPTDTLLR